MVGRLLAIAVITLGLLAGGGSAWAEAVRVASPDQVRAMVAEGAKVVDIRRADEWRETGVIPGSILLTAIDADGRPVPGFPEALAEAVGPDEPVVVICRSGNRSATVSRMLSESAGFSHVVDAGGGMRAWLGAGQPVAPCASC